MVPVHVLLGSSVKMAGTWKINISLDTPVTNKPYPVRAGRDLEYKIRSYFVQHTPSLALERQQYEVSLQRWKKKHFVTKLERKYLELADSERYWGQHNKNTKYVIKLVRNSAENSFNMEHNFIYSHYLMNSCYKCCLAFQIVLPRCFPGIPSIGDIFLRLLG